MAAATRGRSRRRSIASAATSSAARWRAAVSYGEHGAVTAVELVDGGAWWSRRTSPSASSRRLQESVRVQMHLASRGMLRDDRVRRAGADRARARDRRGFVERGVTRDAHEPAVRAALARSLYAIVEACRPLVAGSSLPPHYLALPWAELWPRAALRGCSTSRSRRRMDRRRRAGGARAHAAGRRAGDRARRLARRAGAFDGGHVVAALDWDQLVQGARAGAGRLHRVRLLRRLVAHAACR